MPSSNSQSPASRTRCRGGGCTAVLRLARHHRRRVMVACATVIVLAVAAVLLDAPTTEAPSNTYLVGGSLFSRTHKELHPASAARSTDASSLLPTKAPLPSSTSSGSLQGALIFYKEHNISGHAVPPPRPKRTPFWSTTAHEELIYAKKEIVNAPLVSGDPDLYAPLFQSVSIFKRSYEPMESLLKVFIYHDGA